jgi:hypothetical protein
LEYKKIKIKNLKYRKVMTSDENTIRMDWRSGETEMEKA